MAKKPICSIDNCGKPARGNTELCNGHRIRLWRHGSAVAGGRARQAGLTVAERFPSFVNKTTNCWLWKGSLNNKGYGEIGGGVGQKNLLAHRASWLIHRGDIPDGLGVLHRCDTPSCVNPDHLFLGTQSVNMLDCKAKGRTTAGERNTHAKLTGEDVSKIRRLADEGQTLTSIAHQFAVSVGNVSMIVKRLRWPHIG